MTLSAGTITGSGSISARGGNGNGSGGGGAGGRVAIHYQTNLFAGTISAPGGSGYEAGGAGTIYLQGNSQPDATLIVDNGGLSGAATPLASTASLGQHWFVGNGGIAEVQGSIPVLSNVVVSAGGVLTSIASDTNLYLAILGDLTVSSGAAINLDAKGFAQATGPGAGTSASGNGSGAG